MASSVLHVANVERSLRFYQEAFGFARRFVDDFGVYAELETGSTALALTERGFAQRQAGPTAATAPDAPPPPCEIAVAVVDVPLVLDRALAAGGRLVCAPETKYWGQTVAYIRDPDGHLVQICTAVDTFAAEDGSIQTPGNS